VNPLEHFLRDLALVLVAAALITALFQRLKLPVVLGYLVAGFLVGPRTPPRLVSDPATIQTLSELGVILLMFSIGLQFRVRQVIALAPTAGLTALVEVSLLLGLGYLAGQLLGWDPVASLFAGGVVAISSTMIVAKVTEDRPPRREFSDFLYAVLVFEDLAAVILITLLTSLGSGATVTASLVARIIAGLAVALAILMGGGMLVVPRAVRAVAKLWKPETMLVASVGLCFGMAALAQAAGYSVALGAFLAGCLVAESGSSQQVEGEVRPVRDMFGAIFFVAVGMQFDIYALAEHWPLAIGFTVLVVVGKVVGVSIGAFLAGRGGHDSVLTGMSMAQIGEFAFIIAGVGLHMRAAPPQLYAVAIAVSAITAFTTPWCVRFADPVAAWVDRKLPHRLQTFASLYGSWVEMLGTSPGPQTPGRRIRRGVRFLLLDALMILTTVLTYTYLHGGLRDESRSMPGLQPELTKTLLVVGTLAVLAPFVLGIVNVGRGLGLELAAIALPTPPKGKVDNALAPRRLLAVTIQIVAVLLVGVPLVVATLPVVPAFGGVLVLGGVLALLGVGFWRSAQDLEGHFRAGAEVVVSALAKHSHSDQPTVEVARQLLPGLGDFTASRIGEGTEADGRTLGELNLRGRTGATVVALLRGEERVVFPDAGVRLAGGDLVALTGSHDAIQAAAEILRESEKVGSEE
jgi:K+:H+ antiporter